MVHASHHYFLSIIKQNLVPFERWNVTFKAAVFLDARPASSFLLSWPVKNLCRSP